MHVLRLGISIPHCFVEFNQPKQTNLITTNSLQQILVQFTQHTTLLAISSKNTATCLFKSKFHTSPKNQNGRNLRIITPTQKKHVILKGVQLVTLPPIMEVTPRVIFHRGTELCHRYHLEVHPQAWGRSQANGSYLRLKYTKYTYIFGYIYIYTYISIYIYIYINIYYKYIYM